MTNSYDISIDVSRLLHYSRPQLFKLKDDTILVLIKKFAKYLANVYFNEIYDEVYARRYEGDWEPVEDPGYREYLGTIPTATHILDLIEDAICIKESKGIIYIRIDPEVNYPGSRRSLLEVIRAIDHGTSKFNARPVVFLIAQHLNRSYELLWRQFLYKKGVL